MRCLALGQALRDTGAEVTLASIELPAPISARFEEEAIECRTLSAPAAGSAEDAHAVRALASAIGADWLVADGYRFTPDYITALEGPWRRLVVDDLGGKPPAVDCLLNGNAYATPGLYSGGSTECELLLGPRFAPLRREFAIVPARPPTGELRRVVISLGGADPDNVTLRVMEALRGLDADVRVVIGASHADPPAIRSAAVRLSQEVLVDVGAMAALLAETDLVIGAGGTSALEYARCGVPAILVVLAANQARVVPALAAAGTAVDAGAPDGGLESRLRSAVDALVADRAARAAMAERGQHLVDGRGAARVARVIAAPPLGLRPAIPADAGLLLAWANDADVRAASFRPAADRPGGACRLARLATRRPWRAHLGGRGREDPHRRGTLRTVRRSCRHLGLAGARPAGRGLGRSPDWHGQPEALPRAVGDRDRRLDAGR